ncbi:MAG: AAA family ATPase [Chlorobi bacterium]|nr:AAA family ATPase [Chlorobiota bacterium]
MLIYLIGYMGSGKTTIGKILAKKLGYGFIDLDDMIERKYKIDVSGIFRKYDEKSFRKIEHDSLLSTFLSSDTVIATGGGTPCFFDNMELMNKNGTTVYIEMGILSLFQRISASRRPRPLVEGKSPDELKRYIQVHLKKRLPYYSQALITIKGEDFNPGALIEKIKNLKTLNL